MGLVQSKQGTVTGTPPAVLTITLDAPTGAGNGLVVMVSGTAVTTDPTVSGITLGGSADHFAVAASVGGTTSASVTACWLDLNCAGGQTAVAITVTGSSGAAAVMATVYEFDNLLAASAFDKTASVATTTSPWSSGATATTSQAAEAFIGQVIIVGSSAPVITGPAGPWANLTAQQTVTGSFTNTTMSGWQIVSATGAATYSGTATNAADGTVLVVTLKLSGSTPAIPAPVRRPSKSRIQHHQGARRQQIQAAFGVPAVVLTNNAEGGSNGTTITTGNSGGTSGNAFDSVFIGASSTLTFDNTHGGAHGGLALKLTTPASAPANTALLWGTSLGAGRTQTWFRAYLYFTANPSSLLRVATLTNTTGGSSAQMHLQVSTAGKIIVANSAASPITTSTTSVPLNNWFRVEGFLISSATVGQTELKLFTPMDALAPTETNTSAASQNFATIGGAVFGDTGTAASDLYWLDDLGVSTGGYLGPAGVITPLPVVLSAPPVTVQDGANW